MSDLRTPKAALRHHLQASRENLLWKLEGLSERDLRMPRTPTGTNLIGIVKHLANVEIGYTPTSCARGSMERLASEPRSATSPRRTGRGTSLG